MTDASLQWQTAPGHQVLAAAGKKILRPGGRAATEQLMQWAAFQPNQTVLELAASFGYSAIALAQRYHVRVVGIEKNPESVARAREHVAKAGLSDRIEIIEGDIFHLDRLSEQFDYVLAEAILTMQSAPGKAKILAEIHDRLKPGGKFLSHELLASDDRETEIQRTLAETIRVNSTPLSKTHWIEAFSTAGLTVEQQKTGKMGLLNPRQMLQDEGIVGTAKIVWNVLTRPELRSRILKMRSVFQRYQTDLGHIILCATRV
jgi:predicted O-methyltransferase YrrM